LRPPRPGKYGTLRLTTTGRRSGEPRSVILGYYEDGPDLVSMAMNGWGAAEPAWWLNLQAHPEAVVELAGGIRREVLGRAATDSERERLWQRWREIDKNLDDWAARRPRQTAVVILEPLAGGRMSPEADTKSDQAVRLDTSAGRRTRRSSRCRRRAPTRQRLRSDVVVKTVDGTVHVSGS
jgi:F420H(2)-dependent quinone reductase